MKLPDYTFGFRVVGPVSEARRLVDAKAAFSAHAGCDPRADLDTEVYLSAFWYGNDFRAYLVTHGTPKGFVGPVWSPWLWFDIDRRDDPNAALHDARTLVGFILERYQTLDDDDLLAFFSGGKGYHVGVPLAFIAEPSPTFHLIARRLAEGLAAGARVKIDPAIYDRVRCFRAPNSRHSKTGRHKRRMMHAELFGLTAGRVSELAREPAPFDVPVIVEAVPELETDWHDAEASLERDQVSRRNRNHLADKRLQRDTLEFIKDGADEGERHLRLFKAAANLREFDAAPKLIGALLTEAALDCGLSPTEVVRQIRCGIEHADRQRRRIEGNEGVNA